MNLIVISLIIIVIILQFHWNMLVIKGLHQIAKNQVGSTKMILEYLQAMLNKEGSNGQRFGNSQQSSTEEQ